MKKQLLFTGLIYCYFSNNISFEVRETAKNIFTALVGGLKQLRLQDPEGYRVEINDAKD